jgi:hypothetical protein
MPGNIRSSALARQSQGSVDFSRKHRHCWKYMGLRICYFAGRCGSSGLGDVLEPTQIESARTVGRKILGRRPKSAPPAIFWAKHKIGFADAGAEASEGILPNFLPSRPTEK